MLRIYLWTFRGFEHAMNMLPFHMKKGPIGEHDLSTSQLIIASGGCNIRDTSSILETDATCKKDKLL